MNICQSAIKYPGAVGLIATCTREAGHIGGCRGRLMVNLPSDAYVEWAGEPANWMAPLRQATPEGSLADLLAEVGRRMGAIDERTRPPGPCRAWSVHHGQCDQPDGHPGPHRHIRSFPSGTLTDTWT